MLLGFIACVFVVVCFTVFYLFIVWFWLYCDLLVCLIVYVYDSFLFVNNY